MSLRLSILSVTPSSGSTPATFVVGAEAVNPSGDFTEVFQGRFYWSETDPPQPAYTTPPPAGYQLIQATTFVVEDNPSYNGRYTVYTPVDGSSPASSSFSGGQTTIRVAEPVGAPLLTAHLATGTITSISTYFIFFDGASALVVPPGLTKSLAGLDFPGRSTFGWGARYAQNFARLLQSSAGTTAPADPVPGQLWYDPSTGVLSVFDGGWAPANAGAFAPASSYRHEQTAPQSTWTIMHNLNVPAPYVVHASFFVNTAAGVKPVLPTDVTYDGPNQLTVNLTAMTTGYALIRA